MSKQVTKKESNLPSTESMPEGAWGAENITAEDMIMPRMLLMQPMSDFVTSGVTKMGAIIDSLNKTKTLADEKKHVEVLVFGNFKTWVEYHNEEYHQTLTWGPENANLKYEEAIGNIAVTRDLVQNYYVLDVNDVKDNKTFPYVISFKRTSFRAGKEIGAHLMKLTKQGKNSASIVFQIKSSKQTNDKGTFFTFEVEAGRDTTRAEQQAAFDWYKILQTSKHAIKVDAPEEEQVMSKTSKPSNRSSDLTV